MKSSEVSIQFRMEEETHQKLKYIAKHELRSLNSQIEYFALIGIREFEEKYGPIPLDPENI